MHTDAPPPCVSAHIAAIGLTATALGLLDAALVASGLAGARGSFQFVPMRIWIVAPVMWVLMAALASVVALPLMRRWGGMAVSAALIAVFVAIRLRGHAALLLGALAALMVLFAVLQKWILRWMARPRRAIASGVFGTVMALALLAAAHPLAATSGTPRHGATGPNVIVVFLDTVRYDAVFDADGRVDARLPALARLRAESTAFTQAYATSSWTLPSSLSAVTGLPASRLGIGFDSQIYDRSDPTLAERFQRRGYRTAAVISNSFLNAGTGFARGFDTFQQAQTALDLCRTAPGLMADQYWPWFSAAVCNWTASEVTRRARALLDDEDGPFFLTLNYMDAHEPYYVERSCGEADGYRAALRCLDRGLAPIVDWRSSRRPTVLAVVGDHGEQFGEHGLVLHGNSLYTQVLHVPLMVRPAAGGGAQVDREPISIAALPSLVDGTSARPPREGPVLALLHPPAAANLPSQWSALEAGWHLIVREGSPDRLFNVSADAAEEHDLAATDPRDPAIARLRAAITDMRREPKPDLKRFRSLGYIH
jgi:arylsulfatase A-like enzyme